MSFNSISTEIRRHRSDQPWTYWTLDHRQREIAGLVRQGGSGVLLLSEVAPVITAGRRTAPGDLLLGPEELGRRGIAYYPTDRGGLATYHGPGQWVLFAVDALETLTGDPRGVRKAVTGLLETACAAARRYDPACEIRWGAETGVWGKRGKVAAVGVHIERGVLLHGLSINGFQTETSFVGLRPCGLDAAVEYLLPPGDQVENQREFGRLGETLQAEVFRHLWN